MTVLKILRKMEKILHYENTGGKKEKCAKTLIKVLK